MDVCFCVHAKNIGHGQFNPSPPSMLHLIDDVAGVGVVRYFLGDQSLLPTLNLR